MKFTAQQIAQLIGGVVVGDPQASISTIAKIEEAEPGALAFIANPKYEHFLKETKASIILINNELTVPDSVDATVIRVGDPYAAFAQLMQAYESMMRPQRRKGRETPNFVDETAEIGENVYLGAFSYVGAGAVIEDGAQIYPGVYVGNHARVGANSILYPRVIVYHHCIIGKQVLIHAGAVIGSDGFGFAPQQDGSFKKVPQLGVVEIGDDVEIGANATVDRATMGATKIGQNVKIDNLVQVAHNVVVGDSSAIAAQAGISGSTKIGKYCIIGGQAGIVGHIELADGTRINAQSGVSKSVKKTHTDLSGSPAFDYKSELKSQVVFKRLPDLMNRIEQLEKELSQLKRER